MFLLKKIKAYLKRRKERKQQERIEQKLDLIRRLNEEIAAERAALAIQQQELHARLAEITRYNVLTDVDDLEFAQNKTAGEFDRTHK